MTRLLFVCLATACGPTEDATLDPGLRHVAQPTDGAEYGSANCLHFEGSLEFGAVEIGCERRSSVRLRNTCELPVLVTAVRLGAPKPAFMIVGLPALVGGGLEVAPGAAIPVTVRFAPGGGGRFFSSLAADVLHASDATASSPISGDGVSPTFIVDEHTQENPAAPIDILFVVDNGVELAPWVDSVRWNVASLGKYAQATQGEHRIAIATTGGVVPFGAEPGTIVASAAGERMLDARHALFRASFESIVNAIEPVEEALPVLETAVLAFRQARDEALWRERSVKLLILITARADTSQLDAWDAIGLLTALSGERNPDRFFTAVIGGFTPDCFADDGTLRLLTAQTNGIFENICVPDWMKSLEWGGTHHWGRYQFITSKLPDFSRGPMTVTIDDHGIPAVDSRGATIWSYDGKTQSVWFEPMYIPEPGQTLRVSFAPFCGE